MRASLSECTPLSHGEPPEQPGESLLHTWISKRRAADREKQVMQRAEDALEFLSISHLRDEQAGNLSGGQKKLLEFGRTMMTDAQRTSSLFRASCPPPFGPAFGCSKSLQAFL